MRNLDELNHCRVPLPDVVGGGNGNYRNGAFLLVRNGVELRIIASAGGGWDHVSVSTPDRVPDWSEMEFIKRTFFKDDEVAMQLHVPSKDHININPRTLHLWRPRLTKIPLPPKEYV
jgi:hypothetical protein